MGKLPYYAYFGSSIVYSVPQLHDEMEIYLSLNHNGSFLVQDTRYPLETGSLIIIRPFEIHYLFSSVKDHTDRYALRFPVGFLEKMSTPETNLKKLFENVPHHIMLSQHDLIKFSSLMEDLIAPVRPQFWEDIYRTLLLEKFLLAVARKLHDCKTDETAEIETRDRTIMDTITYISAHYLESIHLDDIATHLYVSKSRLCKIFKDHTGISIGDYMTMLRLQKACVLLKENTMMVRDVAAAVGFKSYPHFIRTFTNKIGMSPKKFVRESKK